MRSTSHSRLPLVAVLVLAGCVAAPPLQGQVGVQEVDSAVPADTRMTLADNELFIRPLPSAQNDMPTYPANMLVHRLPPQAVCVRVSIDEKGAVSATAPIGIGPDCPADANAANAFYEAAQAAASQWRYEPAFLCVFPEDTKASTSGCLGEDVEEVPQAVSLVYRFMFEQVDGKGAVRLMN